MWAINNNNNNCCGCGICEIVCNQHAVTLTPDAEGFFYPSLNTAICNNCGLCDKFCPIINIDTLQLNTHNIAVFAGYFTDSKKLVQSSSGGIATAISEKILSQGGVVAGVAYSNNFTYAEYSLARTNEEIKKFKGSKYIQARKGHIYSDIKDKLKQNIPVLFIGLPCEVGALKSYLGKDYENLLYSCELICHGPTSESIACEYVSLLENKYHSKLVDFSVRYKKNGSWLPVYLYAKFLNGKIFLRPFYDTEYGFAFKNLQRPSCNHCVFKGRNTVADLTIGDYWGCSKDEILWNESGVSVIFVHSEGGAHLLEGLDSFTLVKSTYKRAVLGNSTINESTNVATFRETFSMYLQSKGLRYAYTHTASTQLRIRKWVVRRIPNYIRKKIMLFYANNHK